MNLRWVLWGVLLAMQALTLVARPDALAPAVAGSIYLPLMVANAAGLPVYGRAESGGWAAPSVLGWCVVAVFWALVWWGVATLVARLLPGARLRAS